MRSQIKVVEITSIRPHDFLFSVFLVQFTIGGIPSNREVRVDLRSLSYPISGDEFWQALLDKLDREVHPSGR